MKILSTFLALVVAAPAAAGWPFGFEPCMTEEQIAAKVGKLESAPQVPNVRSANTAPTPHSAFESYVLVFGEKAGLHKVTGVGRTLRDDGQGLAVRTTYADLLRTLTAKYGVPKAQRDSLAAGSLWDEADDWLMGVKVGDRDLAALWLELQDPDIGAIMLQVKALDARSGYVTLHYEFKNVARCSDEQAAKDAAAL